LAEAPRPIAAELRPLKTKACAKKSIFAFSILGRYSAQGLASPCGRDRLKPLLTTVKALMPAMAKTPILGIIEKKDNIPGTHRQNRIYPLSSFFSSSF
jgi:hypothetical protein